MLPGLVVLAAIAAAAWGLAVVTPVPASLAAVLLGITVATGVRLPSRTEPGIRITGRIALLVALLGMAWHMNTDAVAAAGPRVVGLAAIVVVTAIVAAAVVAGRLNVARPRALLLGIGTGICGASAIIAARSGVGGKPEDAATAVATVTVLGTIGMVAGPLLTEALGWSSGHAGAWFGASLHAVPQVMAAAAATAEPAAATTTAALVKLARVATLPIVVAVAGWMGRHDGDGARVPPELIAFAAGLLLSWLAPLTAGGAPPRAATVEAATAGAFLVAFAALGLQTDARAFRRTDLGTLWVGAVTWLAVIAVAAAALRLWPLPSL